MPAQATKEFIGAGDSPAKKFVQVSIMRRLIPMQVHPDFLYYSNY